MNMDERRRELDTDVRTLALDNRFDTCPRMYASVLPSFSEIDPYSPSESIPRQQDVTRYSRSMFYFHMLASRNWTVLCANRDRILQPYQIFIQLTVGERRLDLPCHRTGERNRKDRIVCLNNPSTGCSYTRKTTHLRTHRHAEHDHVHPAQWCICASQRRTSDKTFKDVKADTIWWRVRR